jgi:methanogenic corrinoid protein MtbC1
MAHALVEAMVNMKEKEALQIADELLAKGEDPNKILDLSSEAMQVVGERYQEGTYLNPIWPQDKTRPRSWAPWS